MGDRYDPASFLSMLRSEGIELYIDSVGSLRARGRVTDPDIAEFIRTNRPAIIAELRNAGGTTNG